MRRVSRLTVLAGFLATIVGVLPAAGAARADSVTGAYSSCAALRVDFPAGVARDGGARTAGIRAGMNAPQVDRAAYRANAAFDHNNDGVACPVWRDTLVGSDVEKAIRRGLARQLGGGPYRVTCPANPVARRGRVFRCRVLDVSTSDRAIVTVTQTSNHGVFEWEVTSTTTPTQQA